MSFEGLASLSEKCSSWFAVRKITDAIVGYSGGVDSATTAALLCYSGIKVHLVVAEAPNQKYSSPLGGLSGAKSFASRCLNEAKITKVAYPFLFLDDSANEAAAPIQRVAIFYGMAAQLRKSGIKSIVVGTANFDEAAYLGFWGKASDGNQDLYPFSHLHKSQVYDLASELGVPDEIRAAVPSGDLLFEETNDRKMTGADYGLIESISRAMEDQRPVKDILNLIESAADARSFCRQIIQNSFKYELSFCGFHLHTRLEEFRRNYYRKLLEIVHSHQGACEDT